MKLFLGCFIFICVWYTVTLYVHPIARYDFDAQNISLWRSTARQGLLPMRDVFYPYGLLFYYQEASPIARLGVLLLSTLSLMYCMKTVLAFGKTRTLRNGSVIFLLIIFVRFIGFETWSRYGIVLAMSLWFPTIIISANVKKMLGMGIGIGILFGLIQDQAVYGAMIFCLCALLYRRDVIKSIGWFGVGGVLGLVPFGIYLLSIHGYSEFFAHWTYLREIGLAAKTPFAPFALSASNTYVFSVLFSGIMWVSYSLLIARQKMSRTLLITSSLIGYILLLEQKSILRSIDWQIVLPASVLFVLLLLQSRLKPVVSIALLLLLVLCYPFRSVAATERASVPISPKYEQVIAYLQQFEDYGGKLFTYPGNPIYYQLSRQYPPYFFTSYETTPENAQQQVITYIEQQHINYIVYDVHMSAIQDGVPNYIRNRSELSYLLTHFQATERVGDFLILHRKNEADPKKICDIVPSDSLCAWFTEVNLENIPAEEGGKVTTAAAPITYPFFSQHRFLVMRIPVIVSQITLTFLTEQNGVVLVHMNGCKTCVINLDAVPDFYVPKKIMNITSSTNSEMQLMTGSSRTADFW